MGNITFGRAEGCMLCARPAFWAISSEFGEQIKLCEYHLSFIVCAGLTNVEKEYFKWLAEQIHYIFYKEPLIKELIESEDSNKTKEEKTKELVSYTA